LTVAQHPAAGFLPLLQKNPRKTQPLQGVLAGLVIAAAVERPHVRLETENKLSVHGKFRMAGGRGITGAGGAAVCLFL